jgi:hypothetical protein
MIARYESNANILPRNLRPFTEIYVGNAIGRFSAGARYEESGSFRTRRVVRSPIKYVVKDPRTRQMYA